ncbi:MAG TPA: filamentous hemagglutinin N-terminal domain-containing protein, partial [Gammaproteobacteria bacterium]
MKQLHGMPTRRAGDKGFKAITRTAAWALTATLAFAVMQAQATPRGGQVVAGHGSISHPSQNVTVINQKSNSLVVNWSSFNIGSGQTVQFVQPSASSAALNQIFDQNPTQIFGSLISNGQVFLVNPNGIYFSRDAYVNTGALFASSLGISNSDFMAGKLDFSAPAGQDGGAVINHGTLIAAQGGSVTLIGGSVYNDGVIAANLGQVDLVAGHAVTVDFDGDGLMSFEVTQPVMHKMLDAESGAAVTNAGTIQADGGAVIMTASVARNVFAQAVNNSGVIEATGVQEHNGGVYLAGPDLGGEDFTGNGRDSSGDSAPVEHSGSVMLSGQGGDVVSSGSIDASSQRGDGGYVELHSDGMTLLDGGSIDVSGGQGSGGEVRILGDLVGLFGSTSVDASGYTGGGTVMVGGDYHGGNAAIQNASQAFIGQDVSIDADAIDSGNGGKVVIWSDDHTQYFGNISSRGGRNGGDGGFVEVSGLHGLDYMGRTDLRASHGDIGLLLLDPTNITINNTDSGTSASGGNPNVFSGSGATGSINVATLTAALGTADVQITTASAGGSAGTITVSNNVSWSANTSLTLTANSTISVGATIANSGSGSINLNAGGNITITGSLQTTSGSINVTSGGATGISLTSSATANILTTSGSINLTASAGSILDTNTDGGDVANIITTSGPVTFTSAGSVGNPAGNDMDISGVSNLTLSAVTGVSVTNDSTYTTLNLSLDPTSGGNTYTFTGQTNTITILDGGSNLTLSSITGTTTALSVTDTGTTSSIQIADGGISVGTGNVTLTANSGSITDNTAGATTANITNTGSISLNASTNIGTGAEALDLANTVGTVTATSTGGVINLASTGNLTFGAVSATGNVTLASNASITTTSTVTSGATATINVDANNNSVESLTLGGVVSGTTISMNGGTDLNDTLVAPNTVNTWNITSGNAGTLNGEGFTKFVNLTGGSAVDTFNISAGAFVQGATGIDGGGGSDIINGPNSALTWNITGNNAGNLTTATTTNFTSVENLAGGSAADAFVFSNGVAVTSIDGGGGSDTLNFSAYNTNLTVTLTGTGATDGFNGTTAGTPNPISGGSFSNIDVITSGSGAADVLVGNNANANWNLNATRTYVDIATGNTLTFSAFETLTGGTQNDTFNVNTSQTRNLNGGLGNDSFVFADGVTLTGSIDGQGGTDTLDLSAYTTALTFILSTGNVNGSTDPLTGTFSNMDTLTGGAGGNTFTIDANTTVNLNGGSSTDSFVFGDAVVLTGSIDGKGGSDTLNLSGYTTNLGVTLTAAGGTDGFNGTTSGTPNPLTGTFSNIDVVTAGSGSDTLTGLSSAATWALGASTTYTDNGSGNVVTFSGFQNLTSGGGSDTFNITANNTLNLNGGAGSDSFVFSDGVTLTGSITGGGGVNDTLDLSAYTTALTFILS